jgi:predicted dehydrogenase
MSSSSTGRPDPSRIGLAIVGGGRIGAFRGEVARRHPQVDWIGVAELKPERAQATGEKLAADYVTDDYLALIARPEVTAVIVATDEDCHVGPTLAAIERGLPLLIEKPLADDLDESARVLEAIEQAGVDAVVGYTQRFRQRWLTAKDRISRGALGDVTLVTARGLLNRLIADALLGRLTASGKEGRGATPMVVTGTHMVDLVMWLLEGKTPIAVSARSVDRVMGPEYGSVDATVGIVEFDDGTLCNICSSWALPKSWPCPVYSLDVAIVGTDGILTVDDTHRDVVLAVNKPLAEGYNPDESRLVDFLGSYLPGDVALGELRGPMREETNTWLNRLSMGHTTPHATAADGHQRLMVTKAFDLSAATGETVALPLNPGSPGGFGTVRGSE